MAWQKIANGLVDNDKKEASPKKTQD